MAIFGGTNFLTKHFKTLLFLITTVLLKLYLIFSFPIQIIGNSKYDDFLFVKLAKNIVEGNWLGPYNDTTLCKGPIFSIFIALNSYTNIPIKISEYLLYVLSVIFFFSFYKKYCKKKYLPELLFLLLIFCPYIELENRIVREGIYGSLSIFLVCTCYAIHHYKNNTTYLLSFFSILHGFILFGFWFVKEEGIWIMPLIFFTFLYFTYCLYKDFKFSRLFMVKLVALFLFVPTFMICQKSLALVNFKYYGEQITIEPKSEEYINATQAIYRVKPTDNVEPFLYLNKATRNLIYSVSPSFSEVKEIVEKYKNNVGCWHMPNTCGDIASGWFFWIFKSALAKKGFYKTPAVSKEYFRKVTNEINKACENGTIECNKPKNINLTPIQNADDLKRIFSSFKKGINILFNGCGNYKRIFKPSKGNEVSIDLFKKMTNCDQSRILLDYKSANRINKRVVILRYIKLFYDKIILKISILGILILFIRNSISIIKHKRVNFSYILSVGIISSVLSRLIILGVVDATVFPGYELRYVSCFYPLITISFFTLLNTSFDKPLFLN